MNNVLDEIHKLRNGKALTVDRSNTNRHRLVAQEPEGKTAYYFSCPIYELESRKLIDISFTEGSNCYIAKGSNSNISVSKGFAILENQDGKVETKLPEEEYQLVDDMLIAKTHTVKVTCNGLKITQKIRFGNSGIIRIKTDRPFNTIRSNGKYFALMQDRFLPFATVSLIGIKHGNDLCPTSMSLQKEDSYNFYSHLNPRFKDDCEFVYEVSLYENKLIQDTTVETRNSRENNVYGAVSFLGNTDFLGEQWLYSKIDFPCLSELQGVNIKKAILHMPKIGGQDIDISAYGITERFCSFGSTWDTKIKETTEFSKASYANSYYSLDLTQFIVNHIKNFLGGQNGFILRNSTRHGGYTALVTADSYSDPLILEIRYS